MAAANMERNSLNAAALIVAAGSSRRMGFDKILLPLCGRPLVEWSLDAFERCSEISRGVVVCPADRLEEFSALTAPYPKCQLVASGGKERADSVLNGLSALKAFSPSIVAVHDAARPLITSEFISKVLQAAHLHGAAVAAEPVRDTLHRAVGTALVETVSRENIWAMQTPQAAHFDKLFSALQFARNNNILITDEISALLATGVHAYVVPHTDLNFKVTYPSDLELAEMVLSRRKQRRYLSPVD